MKRYINVACTAVAILAAAACGSQNEAPGNQRATTTTKVADSFNYLRKHVKDELAGTESILPYLKDSITLDGRHGAESPSLSLADKDMWPSFQFVIYASNKKFYLYNEDSKKLVNTIDLSKTYNNEYEVNCYVKSNRIYTINWMSNDMICFDLNGRLVHTYCFPDTSTEIGCRLTAHPGISSFTLNKNNDMAMFMLPYLDESKKEDRVKVIKHKSIALLHLSEDSLRLKNWIGTFPKEYMDHYYHRIDADFINTNDSVIAYLFPISPSLNLENIYTGKLQQHAIKGLPKNMVNPMSEDPEDIQNFSYTKEYQLKNDSYLDLAYDAEKKRYYIFRGLGIAPVTEDGSLALFEDMPVILYVIDAVTNTVIKKINFGSAGKYVWYSHPVIYKSKLYMLRQKGNKRDAPVKIDIYEIP